MERVHLPTQEEEQALKQIFKDLYGKLELTKPDVLLLTDTSTRPFARAIHYLAKQAHQETRVRFVSVFRDSRSPYTHQSLLRDWSEYYGREVSGTEKNRLYMEQKVEVLEKVTGYGILELRDVLFEAKLYGNEVVKSLCQNLLDTETERPRSSFEVSDPETSKSVKVGNYTGYLNEIYRVLDGIGSQYPELLLSTTDAQEKIREIIQTEILRPELDMERIETIRARRSAYLAKAVQDGERVMVLDETVESGSTLREVCQYLEETGLDLEISCVALGQSNQYNSAQITLDTKGGGSYPVDILQKDEQYIAGINQWLPEGGLAKGVVKAKQISPAAYNSVSQVSPEYRAHGPHLGDLVRSIYLDLAKETTGEESNRPTT